MKIVVAGGSGFIGSALVSRLVSRGDDVFVLTRSPERLDKGRPLAWDGRSVGAWATEVASADVVINLAGASIAEGRWTEARKRELISSRLDATRALVAALRGRTGRDRSLISGSAIGYYGLRQDEELDETSPRGDGFLAHLTEDWEAAASGAEPLARVVILRFGVVLAPQGGALSKMLLPFRLGVGGPVASGQQWMSWIALDDLIRMIEWCIDEKERHGVFNATAPNPVRNREFTRALGVALKRPAVFPAPSFALRLLFGEMAGEVLIGGQRVLPKRATREGFTFESPDLIDTLTRML